jgi:hypothetical protein|tara:strand:+ start:2369 stop:2791 length:423 start_codon:yes stop_codon:yes gene_type:complete
MFLVDTNVISESRKGSRANAGVRRFFRTSQRQGSGLFISVVTIGELRRGVELIRHRGDLEQVRRLDRWLAGIVDEYAENTLDFGIDAAQIWGRLRVPRSENALDKQIAATALCYDLTVVTRNAQDFHETTVKLLNPFEQT